MIDQQAIADAFMMAPIVGIFIALFFLALWHFYLDPDRKKTSKK